MYNKYRFLGKIFNKFNPFLYNIWLNEAVNKSLFFIYWDKKCQILEIEMFGKSSYYYLGN